MLSRTLPWRERSVTRPAIYSWFPETAPEISMVSSPSESAASEAGGADAWEAACIRDTLDGRPEAFNPLVARYTPRIRAYLFRMVRDREEAEDLAQETFIKAFRALGQFKPERAFRSWLYAIATNTGLNAIRSRKRRGTSVELDLERVVMSGSGKRACATQDARAEALECAMTQLSPRAARLVALHYQEGFSLAEAGGVLGLSENAAKVALCRARKQLRKLMIKGQ